VLGRISTVVKVRRAVHGPPVQTTGCNNEIARDHKNRLEHREAVWCPPIGVGEALDVRIIEKVHVMPVLTVIGILMTMFIPNYECRPRLEFNNSKLLGSKIHRYIPGQQRARSLATLICACEIDNLMNNQVPEIGQRMWRSSLFSPLNLNRDRLFRDRPPTANCLQDHPCLALKVLPMHTCAQQKKYMKCDMLSSMAI
jgi:hypothetical protein